MKKFFLFCMIALVGMCGLNSCSDDCNHDYIEVDYSKKLAGTWTCIDAENEFAEALIFNADGTVTSTGVFEGGYYEKKGTFNIKGNQMTLSFEDGDGMESRFEMVEGEVFSLVDDELDVHFNYYYCENDLSDEIVGMWVNNNAPAGDEGVITIKTFKENGKSTFTGYGSSVDGYVVKDETDYKVVGDLLFYALPQDMLTEGECLYIALKLTYAPNGNSLGDIMVQKSKKMVDGKEVERTSTMLRIKQELNLTGKTYDYISAYVTNANGKNEDFTIFDHTFNFANISADKLDVFYRSELFCLDLNANSIKHHFHPYDRDVEVETPITVDGNKVTLDFSAIVPALRKVEMYMFQDADDCQLHIYMPTKSFINYFANLEIVTMLQGGKIDPTDAAAVEKVFTDMEARIESINVSFVMKVRE